MSVGPSRVGTGLGRVVSVKPARNGADMVRWSRVLETWGRSSSEAMQRRPNRPRLLSPVRGSRWSALLPSMLRGTGVASSQRPSLSPHHDPSRRIPDGGGAQGLAAHQRCCRQPGLEGLKAHSDTLSQPDRMQHAKGTKPPKPASRYIRPSCCAPTSTSAGHPWPDRRAPSTLAAGPGKSGATPRCTRPSSAVPRWT